MNKNTYIRTKEGTKLFDTTSRVFSRFFGIQSKISFTREEAQVFEGNKSLINEINELISYYKDNTNEAIREYSRIWFTTDLRSQRYVQYIELLVYFDNVSLINRERLIYDQISYMKRILKQIKASMSAQSHAKQLTIKIIIKMNILKNTENGLVVVNAIAISDNLAEKFENCSSYKNKAILKECPSFSKFEIEDNPYGDDGFKKMVVVTSQEIKPTDLDEINKLAEMQNKAVKAILKRESTSLVLSSLNADITGQYIKIHDINKAIYGSETEEN